MAGTVGHIGDLLGIGLAIDARAQLVEQAAHGLDDVDIGLLVPAAHVIGFAQLAGLKNAADGAAMVVHIQPVTHLHAVAVDGQRLAGQRIDNDQRDQLFGEMQRAVVVAAVGRQHRQAIGVMPGPHQVVGSRLAGRVRAVGLVIVLFGKRRVRGRQRAIDLVGGDMQKAKTRLGLALQTIPIGTHGLQQAESAHHIGLYEILGTMNGAVHMRLGRKVHHGAWLVLRQQLRQLCTVADIGLHKHMAGIALQAGQILQIACIGQFVDIDHRLVHMCQPIENKVGADKACTASHENALAKIILRNLHYLTESPQAYTKNLVAQLQSIHRSFSSTNQYYPASFPEGHHK